MKRKIKYKTKTLKQLFELYEEQNSSINKEIAEKEKELIANEIKDLGEEQPKVVTFDITNFTEEQKYKELRNHYFTYIDNENSKRTYQYISSKSNLV